MRSVLGTAGAFQTPHISVDVGPNGIDHTLICKKGGYVSMRHNALRDLNAEMQREVCRDVVTEPICCHLMVRQLKALQHTGQLLISPLEVSGAPSRGPFTMSGSFTQMLFLTETSLSLLCTLLMRERKNG